MMTMDPSRTTVLPTMVTTSGYLPPTPPACTTSAAVATTTPGGGAMPSPFPFLSGHHHQHFLQARMQAIAAAAAANSTSTPKMSSSNGDCSSAASPLSSSSSSAGLSPEDKNMSTTSGSSGGETPMSRTNQYKKIMKPLLERKRRARINKCLDELKDIMTVALQAQGENVSKLEKADILELTVRHLHKLQASQRLFLSPNSQVEEAQRFQAGYQSCAQEAASFLLSSPGVDVRVSQRLWSHLSSNITSSNGKTSNSVLSAANNNHETTTSPTKSSSGFHSPPPTSDQTKVEPPPRPNSNPVSTLGHFTLSITKADDDSRMPLKPEPIRLNPNDKMWRPF